LVVKIKRRGFYGKDKKTAMCECVNGRKKEKGKVSFNYGKDRKTMRECSNAIMRECWN